MAQAMRALQVTAFSGALSKSVDYTSKSVSSSRRPAIALRAPMKNGSVAVVVPASIVVLAGRWCSNALTGEDATEAYLKVQSAVSRVSHAASETTNVAEQSCAHCGACCRLSRLVFNNLQPTFTKSCFPLQLGFRNRLRRPSRAAATIPNLHWRSLRWWSKDTVAVITGANQGIGYEIARQLAQNGLTTVSARSEERGKAATEALKKELPAESSQDLIAFHPLDVTSDKSVAALVQWLRQTYGGVDILVNNAGISRAPTEAEIFDANYYGVKRVTEAVLPLLRPSPAGARIVMVSSALGMLQRLSNKYCEEFKQRDQITEDEVDHFIQDYLETSETGEWPEYYRGYSMTKVALNGYTSVLAREVEAESKVYVNCFNPGPTKTNLNDYQGTNTLEEAAMTGIWLALHPPGGPHGKLFDQQLRGELSEW